MATAKRKQDEKNLKILRELVSQPGNKECFDCHQRGPTYVNMTIGSFVCTSCSGMLRGLTPPHRVKSISMATFTQEEIDFIKERGNEHCRRIWLGLTNPPNSPPPITVDTKDEQKMKDLMSAKYELKRYYLDPSMANQNSNQKTQQPSNQTVIPRVPHSGTTTLPSSTSALKTNNVVNFNSNFSADFIADFSKVPDPFTTIGSGGGSGTTTNTVSSDTTAAANRLGQPTIIPQSPQFFANFDNNPIFDSRNNKCPAVDQFAVSPVSRLTIGGNSANATNANGAYVLPPSEDRYAALKDLDSLMKQMKDDTKDSTTGSNTSAWTATSNGGGGGGVTYNNASQNPIWSGVGNQTANVISNPFATNDLWQPSANVVNNNTQSSIDTSSYNPVNPFKPVQFPMNNDPQWVGTIGPSSNGRDVIQFSELMTRTATTTNKRVWQPTHPAYHANPFMVGSGPVASNMTRNSNNPFL
ncbi:arf-GAP domain and FG repeat-containing protein 1 isoform X2 [Ceratina calcarata]|uniref:Arf-GAP domain and FG repeat-containing protein 1 isoform X2 n=1 Tax=Ceratina calcarata TaxID=156304 RepID=A0AAJ7SB95_9HYME|nr:arf-GAP domain and FG repeat-containing protein 1 isoform X2 [Ceratina calcarata]